jgi:hypothetical protein
MNQPAIEHKMSENEARELRQAKAKIFEVIYLELSKHETHTNNAGQAALKLTNSVLQDMEVFIENAKSRPLE